MARLYMLIGVPASGKSTWIAKQPFDWNRTVIISTDNYIERLAKEQGKTYNDVFKDHIDAATAHMRDAVKNAVENDLDIIWDQTNTTIKSRKNKLRMIPDTYDMIAVVFPTPDATEHQRRLGSRDGKHIPDNVMQSMQDSFQMPTRAEGFDEIVVI